MPGRDDVKPTTPGVKLTNEDFVPGRLYLVIASWLETNAIGEVFLSPLDVVFTNLDVVEPDLLYVSNERGAQVLTPANVRDTPELVVEIGSPTTRQRDETIKKRLYERTGVSEYWIVDPELDVIRLCRCDGDRFGGPTELSGEVGDVLETPLLPELQISLSRIFAD